MSYVLYRIAQLATTLRDVEDRFRYFKDL